MTVTRADSTFPLVKEVSHQWEKSRRSIGTGRRWFQSRRTPFTIRIRYILSTLIRPGDHPHTCILPLHNEHIHPTNLRALPLFFLSSPEALNAKEVVWSFEAYYSLCNESDGRLNTLIIFGVEVNLDVKTCRWLMREGGGGLVECHDISS